MPTAVITESSENTMSSITIWAMIGQKAACAALLPCLCSALEPLVDLGGRLDQQEHAADDQDQVAPRELEAARSRTAVAVSDITQVMLASSPRRISSASERPMIRARSRCVGRQLVREDGDEDQVVDAQHDLEHDEREQADPDGRISDPFHVLPPRIQSAMSGSKNSHWISGNSARSAASARLIAATSSAALAAFIFAFTATISEVPSCIVIMR